MHRNRQRRSAETFEAHVTSSLASLNVSEAPKSGDAFLAGDQRRGHGVGGAALGPAAWAAARAGAARAPSSDSNRNKPEPSTSALSLLNVFGFSPTASQRLLGSALLSP